MLVPAPDHEVMVAAPHDGVVAGVKLASVIPRDVDIVDIVDSADIVDMIMRVSYLAESLWLLSPRSPSTPPAICSWMSSFFTPCTCEEVKMIVKITMTNPDHSPY